MLNFFVDHMIVAEVNITFVKPQEVLDEKIQNNSFCQLKTRECSEETNQVRNLEQTTTPNDFNKNNRGSILYSDFISKSLTENTMTPCCKFTVGELSERQPRHIHHQM